MTLKLKPILKRDLDRLEREAKELAEKLEDKEHHIEITEPQVEVFRKEVAVLVKGIEGNEDELIKAIKARKEQPLGKIRKGLQVNFWNGAPGNHVDGYGKVPKELHGDWNVAGQAEWVMDDIHKGTKFFWVSNSKTNDFYDHIAPHFSAVHKDAKEFSLRLNGVIDPKITGRYTFEVSSDDGAHLDLGAEHNKEAEILSNKGYGHLKTKKVSVHLKEGLPQEYNLVYFMGNGQLAELRLTITDPKGRFVPLTYMDHSMSRTDKVIGVDGKEVTNKPKVDKEDHVVTIQPVNKPKVKN